MEVSRVHLFDTLDKEDKIPKVSSRKQQSLLQQYRISKIKGNSNFPTPGSMKLMTPMTKSTSVPHLEDNKSLNLNDFFLRKNQEKTEKN